MHKFEVGKPYSPLRSAWPECAQYNYRGGNHELVLFWRSPSEAQVRAVRRNQLDLGLLVLERVIFLLYRFRGAADWSDAPFSWWLVPEDERTMPNPESTPEERALLQIFLVDAASGILKTMRACTMSPEFTAAIHVAIRQQALHPFDQSEHDAIISRAYKRFPHSARMAQAVAVKCTGGD